MSGERKITMGLVLRGVLSVAVGMAIVTAFVALLSLYGEQETVTPQVATKTIPFPENEHMLDSMSEQLARDAAAMSEIEPAAGEPSPLKKKN